MWLLHFFLSLPGYGTQTMLGPAHSIVQGELCVPITETTIDWNVVNIDQDTPSDEYACVGLLR